MVEKPLPLPFDHRKRAARRGEEAAPRRRSPSRHKRKGTTLHMVRIIGHIWSGSASSASPPGRCCGARSRMSRSRRGDGRARFHQHAARRLAIRSTARSARSTASSSSAASRSTRKSARPATASICRVPRPRELGYSEAEVRAIADQWPLKVPSINPDTGEPADPQGDPGRPLPVPLCQRDRGARAPTTTRLPPDLSLMTKAREGGAAYVYSLLTGYQQPAGATCRAESGRARASTTTPISPTSTSPWRRRSPRRPGDLCRRHPGDQRPDGAGRLRVPRLDRRAQAGRAQAQGIAVLIFLLFGTILAYMAYQNVWAGKKH